MGKSEEDYLAYEESKTKNDLDEIDERLERIKTEMMGVEKAIKRMRGK